MRAAKSSSRLGNYCGLLGHNKLPSRVVQGGTENRSARKSDTLSLIEKVSGVYNQSLQSHVNGVTRDIWWPLGRGKCVEEKSKEFESLRKAKSGLENCVRGPGPRLSICPR